VAVQIDVDYRGDLHCEARHAPSGASFTTDAPVDNGGRGEAFSPTDLVAAGIGSCVLTVMGIVARRRELSLEGARVTVSKEMTADPVRRIGRLTVEVTLPAGLGAEDRALLERTAKACPVAQSLHPDLSVTMRFAYV
jgi:putative redox protein